MPEVKETNSDLKFKEFLKGYADKLPYGYGTWMYSLFRIAMKAAWDAALEYRG